MEPRIRVLHANMKSTVLKQRKIYFTQLVEGSAGQRKKGKSRIACNIYDAIFSDSIINEKIRLAYSPLLRMEAPTKTQLDKQIMY